MTKESSRSAGDDDAVIRWLRSVGLVAFMAALWLPVIQMCLPFITEYEDTENRELADPPSLALTDLRRLIPSTESYLSDRFGLRTTLIRWNSILRISLLGVSPIPSVVVGKDGWLFYRSEVLADGNSLNDHRGTIPLSDSELAKLWKRIQDNHRVFSQMGLPYLVVIAPNKHTLYSEYLPNQMCPFRSPTRLQQFSDFLSRQPSARSLVLDLRGPLLEAKAKHPVYWKTDSHWNSYGAYIGYREIMERLWIYDSELAPLPLRDDRVTVAQSPKGGDLTQMLLMQDRMPEPYDTQLELAQPSLWKSKRTLLLRHDSFGDGLYPFLNVHFEALRNIAPFAPFPFAQIAAERPVAVIHVFAERYLTQAIHDDFFYQETRP
jgi:alginate O-acetyltransferase complex protein AlgJ